MATQVLTPDAVLTATNLTGATPASLAAQDTSWAAVTSNTAGTDLIVSMPTPAGQLTGQQTITVQARKNATGGSAASFTIAVREGGVDKAVSPSITVDSTTGSVHTFTWDSSILADPSGAGVEIHLVGAASGGKPADRRTIGFGYVGWTANYSLEVVGRPKVWTGSAFTAKPAKVWNGTSWVEKPMKVWNGLSWVPA